jgi:hypothetical protein
MGAVIAVALAGSPRAVERKRCSDFDWECVHVMDHARCHAGGTLICGGGELVEMDPADGDCPYLTFGANA